MSPHDNGRPGRNVAPLAQAPVPIRPVGSACVCAVWGVIEEFVCAWVCACVSVTCSRLASISCWILCQARSVWHATCSLLPDVPEMDEHWCECSTASPGCHSTFPTLSSSLSFSFHLYQVGTEFRYSPSTTIAFADLCFFFFFNSFNTSVCLVRETSVIIVIWLPDISVFYWHECYIWSVNVIYTCAVYTHVWDPGWMSMLAVRSIIDWFWLGIQGRLLLSGSVDHERGEINVSWPLGPHPHTSSYYIHIFSPPHTRRDLDYSNHTQNTLLVVLMTVGPTTVQCIFSSIPVRTHTQDQQANIRLPFS